MIYNRNVERNGTRQSACGTSASEITATLRGIADTELILGLAGIGGTLLASTTGLGSTLWLERRRQAREDRQERHKLRTAARLVHTEIARNAAFLNQAQPVSGEGEPVVLRSAIPLEQSNWKQYAAVLATIDDREAWIALAMAYSGFAGVVGDDQRFPETFAPTLIQQANDAINALRPHV